MKQQLAFHPAAAADGVLTENHSVFRGLDREHAQVKELVMQRTQGQAVGFDVRPTDVMPLDVRGLQPSRRMSDAQVEAADTAPVLVGTQHPLAKSWVTSAALDIGMVNSRRVHFAHFAGPVEI